jgi:hypothetical protein
MQPCSTTFRIVCTLVLGLSGPMAFASEADVFEIMDPGAQALAYCQTAHRIATCEQFHINEITVTAQGAELSLDGQRYAVEWTGPGYYLESGVILQPLGEARSGLQGQRWLEVYPEHGKIHTSQAWQDQDGNRVLSVSDTLKLGTRKDSRALKIKDVRLQFRARLLTEGAERPDRAGRAQQR